MEQAGGDASRRARKAAVGVSDLLITRVWCREREDVERLRRALLYDDRPVYAFDEHVTFTRVSQADLAQLAERLGIHGWHASDAAP